MLVRDLMKLLEGVKLDAEVRISTAGHDFEVPTYVDETPDHNRVVIYTKPV